MEQKGQYLEKGRHGTPMFPVEYYDCEYPANLAGLPVHWHEEFEVTYVRKGSCTYLIDLMPIRVKKGDFLFLPSGVLHGIPEGWVAWMYAGSNISLRWRTETLDSRMCFQKKEPENFPKD